MTRKWKQQQQGCGSGVDGGGNAAASGILVAESVAAEYAAVAAAVMVEDVAVGGCLCGIFERLHLWCFVCVAFGGVGGSQVGRCISSPKGGSDIIGDGNRDGVTER